jgi:dissimilatory sulfite reductase (desulfoviridin) alpha/beta subunit
VGGKLGRHPRLASELPGIHDARIVLETVGRCLGFYQEHCKKGERFGEILDRCGREEILAEISPCRGQGDGDPAHEKGEGEEPPGKGA